MKWEQLTESTTAPIRTYSDLLKFVNEHCQPYIHENPYFETNRLYRGMKTPSTIASINTIRKDRLPKDTAKQVQKELDEEFISQGFKAIRSNSMFCIGESYNAEEYGEVHVVYPMGNFEYTWSPEIRDLTVALYNQTDASKFVPSDNKTLNVDEFPESIRISIDARAENKGLEKLSGHISTNDLIKLYPDNVPKSISYYFSKLNLIRIDTNFSEIVKEYQTTDLVKAIESGNEIMITGDKYLAIPFERYTELKRYHKETK